MKKYLKKFALVTAVLFSSPTLFPLAANAYLTVGETAEVLPEGYFKMGLQPQLIVSDGSGFNMGAYFDANLEQSIDGRIEFRFGQELKRHEEFKFWYLHVWAWKKNSAGLFSDWDPSITCS